MPSFSLFQKAPAALCIPLRPVPLPLSGSACEDRCWMMVLLTMYLNLGWPSGPEEVSSTSLPKMVLIIVVFQISVSL